MPDLYFKDQNGLPVHMSVGGDFKPGDPAPSGYGALEDWHLAQRKAGYRQKRTSCCGIWVYDFEKCRCEKPSDDRMTLKEFNAMVREVTKQVKAGNFPTCNKKR